MSRSEKNILLLVIICAAILIGYLGLTRSFYTYATETDYLGAFRLEAERLLQGKPLLLSFHPPFYSIILAAVQSFVGNWFTTGIIVSIVACLVTLFANFFLLEKSCGRYGGWAALAGLAISYPFLSFSCFATSDAFFFALYSVTLLAACVAYENNSKLIWFVCGAVCGLAFLTRSNSITLFALFLVPWLSGASPKQRFANFLSMIIGLCIPVAIWVSFAKATGSPLVPGGNHVNLALTYFAHGADRISGDARAPLEKEFTSLWQVLFYDPVHIVKTYISDLIENKAFTANELLPFPLNYLAIFSLVAMIFRKPASLFWYYLIVLTVLQVLLVNFKAYETRYYLFLIPIIAAPIGVVLVIMTSFLPKRIGKILVLPIVIAGLAFVGKGSFVSAYVDLHRDDKEMSEALKIISLIVNSSSAPATIVARKPHIPYYLGVDYKFIPQVKTVSELEGFFEKNKATDHLYLFYGQMEKHSRPQFKDLQSKSFVFETVARSETENLWVLYEYTGRSSEHKND